LDIIMLGFNFDVGPETEIVLGILMRGGFTVKYPSQRDLDAFVRGRGQVALQRLNLCFGICAYVISPTGALAKGLSDGQQTSDHKISQPQLPRLWR
jgi:hypothetical protein